VSAFVPGDVTRVAPLARGPLDGLRFAVKDLIDVAGVRTGGGNPDWLAAQTPAREHASCVSVLLRAGAALEGKTITDELAYSLEGANHHYGTPLNPRWPHALPGGSSSGSASAVAAGTVDFALGTDTGGSVRIPAAFCGLYGMRPTHGAIALDGLVPFAPSLDTVGWFARSADLLTTVGDVLLPADSASSSLTLQRVAANGCAVVLVTHKLKEICRIATHATVLQSGRVVTRSDAPANDIDRLVDAMIRRAAHAQAADLHAQLSLAQPHEGSPWSRSLSDEVLQIDGLAARDAEGVLRLADCTLVVNRSEIVGIAGVEGNGQSELGAVLAGMTPAAAGRFFVAGQEMTRATPRELTRAGVGIVPEDRHAVGCVTGMSLVDNLMLNHLDRYSRAGWLQRRAMRERAIELMERFDIRASGPDAIFGGLSGGNQQKAVLARELTLDPLHFLLAAQPTRGLDVGAVAAVYRHIRAARERGVGVLLISSELDELMSVADRIVVLYRGRIMGSCTPDAANRSRIGAWMAGAGESQ